jgi:hypothetical protein
MSAATARCARGIHTWIQAKHRSVGTWFRESKELKMTGDPASLRTLLFRSHFFFRCTNRPRRNCRTHKRIWKIENVKNEKQDQHSSAQRDCAPAGPMRLIQMVALAAVVYTVPRWRFSLAVWLQPRFCGFETINRHSRFDVLWNFTFCETQMGGKVLDGKFQNDRLLTKLSFKVLGLWLHKNRSAPVANQLCARIQKMMPYLDDPLHESSTWLHEPDAVVSFLDVFSSILEIGVVNVLLFRLELSQGAASSGFSTSPLNMCEQF